MINEITTEHIIERLENAKAFMATFLSGGLPILTFSSDRYGDIKPLSSNLKNFKWEIEKSDYLAVGNYYSFTLENSQGECYIIQIVS